MKKFTVSLLTALLFSVSVLCGYGDSTIISGFAEAAFEITSENELIDESICFDVEDYTWSSGLSSGIQYLYNEDTFSYYDQLNDNNKSAYDAMKAWLEPNTDEFSISLPDSISYETADTNMSTWDDDQKTEFWTLVLSAIRDGELALNYDYPELFWLDASKITVSISNIKTGYNFMTRTYTMKISELKVKGAVKEEYTDVETAAEFKAVYDEAVSAFEVKGEDNYSKIKYIHDSIASKVNYDLSAPYHDTALGFFIEPYSIVCEGYSKAVKILCDKENIPCIVVVGNVNLETNFAHMWNYIQMEDGKWYGLDCTWDDLDDESNPIKYQYFLKGSSFNSNHTPDTEYISTAFTYPLLSESDYVYASGTPETTTAVPVETTVITTTTAVSAVTSEILQTSTSMPLTTSASNSETDIETSAITDVTTSVSSSSTTVPETSEHDTVIKGDFNCDKTVSIADLVVLQKKLLKIIEINDYDFDVEMNNDGKINIFDWIELRRLFIKT